MRKRYLGGKYAIHLHLLIPMVYELANHPNTSQIDVICDIMGHGLQVDKIKATKYKCQKISKIIESQWFAEIYDNYKQKFPNDASAATIWKNKWSDDMDPIDTIKSNRNSFWIKTVTVAPPHREMENIHIYTYTIAIWFKIWYHDEVKKRFAVVLKLSCNGTEKGQLY